MAGQWTNGDDYREPDSEASVFTAQSDDVKNEQSQLTEEDKLDSQQLAPPQEQNPEPTMDLSDNRKKASLDRSALTRNNRQ